MARILFADDNSQLRAILVEAIAEAGHTCTGVPDGRRVIELLAVEPFDVVVTDMLMPEADGAEVMQVLRRMDPRPIVLVISGGGQIDPFHYLSMAKAMGADQVLKKPFAPSVLVSAIERLLEQRQGHPG